MSHVHYTSQLSQQGALPIGSRHEQGYQAAVLGLTPRVAEALGGRWVLGMATGSGMYGIRAAALARAGNDGHGRRSGCLAYWLSR